MTYASLKVFFMLYMFVGHQEVLITTSFRFHTYLIEVATLAQQHAYYRRALRVFPAWTFSESLPSH